MRRFKRWLAGIALAVFTAISIVERTGCPRNGVGYWAILVASATFWPWALGVYEEDK